MKEEQREQLVNVPGSQMSWEQQIGNTKEKQDTLYLIYQPGNPCPPFCLVNKDRERERERERGRKKEGGSEKERERSQDNGSFMGNSWQLVSLSGYSWHRERRTGRHRPQLQGRVR